MVGEEDLFIRMGLWSSSKQPNDDAMGCKLCCTVARNAVHRWILNGLYTMEWLNSIYEQHPRMISCYLVEDWREERDKEGIYDKSVQRR